MRSAFSIVASRMAPRTAPITVPEPPKMLTPPTTTAAITWSSSPLAANALTLPNREPHSTPAIPAQRPQTTNAPKMRR